MVAPHDGAPPVGIDDLTAMIDLLREAGWRQVRLRVGDFELELSDGSLGSSPEAAARPVEAASSFAVEVPPTSPAPATSPLPVSASLPTDADANDVVIRAQSIGIFWRSPQPGAPPFVEVGDTVTEDMPLAIIEVMKMMTRVQPATGGVVTAIHVKNGDVVEFDQPLVTIRMG